MTTGLEQNDKYKNSKHLFSKLPSSALSGLEVDAINGSLWTLKNEVVFYVLVPVIFMLYKKWGGALSHDSL